MASGGRRVVTGSFKGTGADKEIKTVDFKPTVVRLTKTAGTAANAVWTESMAEGSMQKTVDDAGGARVTNVTGGTGVTPLASGFKLGADADLNVAGEVVHWECVD